MMQDKIPIMMLELKGFTVMATELARDVEIMGITPERIRASAVLAIEDAIDTCNVPSPLYTERSHAGSDTWYFNFNDIEAALRFGCRLLGTILQFSSQRGLYFLKPALALSIGRPRTQGGKIMDDTSIATYRSSDKGKPFTFYVLGEAATRAQRYDWIHFIDEGIEEFQSPVQIVDWQRTARAESSTGNEFFRAFPTLLLDNEVMYAKTVKEALGNLKYQQSRSHSFYAFGGPVPYDIPMYREYLLSMFRLFQKQKDSEWIILSYIPINEVKYGYAWLEMCRHLSVLYSQRFSFAAFPIPKGQLRPFSYHVFDNDTVHIGLRAYSALRPTPILSSAIMFKNTLIAEKFKTEFLENWRRIGPLNDEKYAKICKKFTGLSAETRKTALQAVNELITSGQA